LLQIFILILRAIVLRLQENKVKITTYLALSFLFATASRGSHAFLHDYLSQQAQEIRHRPTRTKVLKGVRCADKVAQWCESDEQFKKTPIAQTVKTLVNLEGMLDEYGNLIPDVVDMATSAITTWDEGKKRCNALYMGPLQSVAQALTSLEQYQMNGGPPSSGGGQWLALGSAVVAAGAAYWKWKERKEYRERKERCTFVNDDKLESIAFTAIAPRSNYAKSFPSGEIGGQHAVDEGFPFRFFGEDQTLQDIYYLKGIIAMCDMPGNANHRDRKGRHFYYGRVDKEGVVQSRKEMALYTCVQARTANLRSEAVHLCESDTCRGHSVFEQCGADFTIPKSLQSLRALLFKRRILRGGRLRDNYEESSLSISEENIFKKIAAYLGEPDPSIPEDEQQQDVSCFESIVLPQDRETYSSGGRREAPASYKRDDTALLCKLAVVDLYDGVTIAKVNEVLDLFEAAREANKKDCWSEQARQTRMEFIDRINKYAIQYRARRQKVWAIIGMLERWKRLRQCECLAKDLEAARKDIWYKTKAPKNPVKLGPLLPAEFKDSCFVYDIAQRIPRGIGGRTMQLRAQINHWFFNQLSLLVMHYKEVLAVLKGEGGLLPSTHTNVQSGDLRGVLRSLERGCYYDEWVRLFGVYLAPEDVITSLTMFDSFKSCYDSWLKTKEAWTQPFHSLISEEDWQECIKEAREVDALERSNEYGKAFFEECQAVETNPSIKDMPTGEQVLRTAHACREGITSRVLIDMALDFVAGKKMTWLRSSAVGGGEQSPPSTVVEVAPETAGAAAGAGSLLEGDGVRRR
jgi:hypothetical protein